jgi:HK97 family phage portal protein
MEVSAVFAAVSLISNDVAALPLMLYRRLPNGGKDRYENHPLYRLLHDAPNPEMTSIVFRRTLQAHACIFQNAYAEIERDMANRPIALWPLIPDRVQVLRDGAGTLFYRVLHAGGGSVDIPAANMIHLIGQSDDGSVGSSLVGRARESIGLAMAAERFGGTFFGNGMTFGGVISYPGPKPPELSEKSYLDQLKSRHEGVEKAHKLLALYNSAKYEKTGVTPNDGQFLETRVFQIREVARWFNIPPHKLADLADATFSNVEHQRIDYYTSCLRPWLTLWEQELGRKLISPLERNQQFIEHVTQDLLRADAAGRAALYTAQFSVGAITPNEIRGFENMDPLPGGDRAFVQLNNVFPLDRIDEWVDAELAAKKAPEVNAPPAPNPPGDEMNALVQSVEARMAEHAARLAAEAARSAALDTQLAEKAQTVEELEREREQLRTAIAERDQAAAELDRQHLAELESHVHRTAAQIADLDAQWTADRAAIAAQRDALQAAKNDADVMLGVAERERDEARQALEAVTTREREWQSAIDTLNGELEELRAAQATADAVAEELRKQLAEQRDAAERMAQAHATAEAARVLADAERADNAAALVLAEAERATVTRAKADTDTRLQAFVAAQRALIVDALERLLQREADRARKAQATPEKLRAWVESFYQTHAETCRSVLRPVVLAWAPCAGANPDAVLAELVQSHIDTSRRDLRLAADTEDPDELAANLARVLRRWETERADAVADRLIAEGDRYGH